MSGRRQKNQLELALMTATRSEASRAVREGTEARMAKRKAESPGVSEPLMEEVIERENLKQALGESRLTKGVREWMGWQWRN
jgi:hypothetical protein